MTAASIDQDEHLDDLLGKAPEESPDDNPANDIPDPVERSEPEPDPSESRASASEELAGEASDADEEDPGNLRLPSSEQHEAEDPIEEDDDQATDRAASAKREEGLQAEVQRLRLERRQHAVQAAQQQQQYPPQQPQQSAPMAPDPGVPPADPNRIPVVVAEDGQSVFVDQEALTAQMQATARSAYEDAMRPTPEQVRAENTRQFAQGFIGENPERNQPIFEDAQRADDFISMALINAAQQQGFQPRSIEDVNQFLHHTGIDKQVEEFFPDIAENLDEFVAAYASDNTAWKHSVLNRIGGVAPQSNGNTVRQRLESVGNAPTSLARKGSGRSQSPSTDEREFESLEKGFRENMWDFPEEKYERMQALGKKLGISGLE